MPPWLAEFMEGLGRMGGEPGFEYDPTGVLKKQPMERGATIDALSVLQPPIRQFSDWGAKYNQKKLDLSTWLHGRLQGPDTKRWVLNNVLDVLDDVRVATDDLEASLEYTDKESKAHRFLNEDDPRVWHQRKEKIRKESAEEMMADLQKSEGGRSLIRRWLKPDSEYRHLVQYTPNPLPAHLQEPYGYGETKQRGLMADTLLRLLGL